MNLGELKQLIDVILERDPSKVEDRTVIRLAQQSIGGVAKVEITSALSGFDWDSGFFVMTPGQPVIRRPAPENGKALAESATVPYFYHLVDDTGKPLCLTNDPVLRTRIPENAWGYKVHAGEKFCRDCEKKRYGL
jgi:hypothetical protein